MNRANRLHHLARLAGIVSGYHDERGVHWTTSDMTMETILLAMGFAVDTDDALERSIRQIEDDPWRRMLPPALVLIERPDAPPTIPVTVPHAGAHTDIAWELEDEAGTVVGGTAHTGDLPCVEQRLVDDVPRERKELALPAPLRPGYYTFRIVAEDRVHTLSLIVSPGRCHFPAALATGPGAWGFAVQLYGVTSATNWGMGDFGDLRQLGREAGALGADILGINPLHALALSEPTQPSPYSPSTRVLLNALYIDVNACPDLADCELAKSTIADPAFQEALQKARSASQVDYGAVAALKLEILQLVYRCFRERHLDAGDASPEPERIEAFRSFQAARGAPLRQWATFEALSEHFGGHCLWTDWPPPYRDPHSPQVMAFGEGQHERIEFFEYLQWIADTQLAIAAQACRDAGMRIGLYLDLAVGVGRQSAEVWAQQSLFVSGLGIGAPPDEANRLGQGWGLVPMNPMALRELGYRPFIDVLRGNMRHGGALRIDHAMLLQRLFWVPDGTLPTAGTYVEQPFEDLVAILALESMRQKCVVIGEDLGTVPAGFRERMQEAGVLSYRPLYFQYGEDGGFLPPTAYPPLSMVVVGTHDLATFTGFWSGDDIALRTAIGLYPNDTTREQAVAQRESDRRGLIAALKAERLLPADFPDRPETVTPALIDAVHDFLARSPGRLVMVRLEDALDVPEQSNIPGTIGEYPNWRTRLPLPLDAMMADARVRRLAALLAQRRSRP